MKKICYASSIIVLFFTMLFCPKETFHGASEGLLLWFEIVLPTLLPVLIVSGLLIKTNIIRLLAKVLYPVLGPLFHVSPYGSFTVLSGFLCGYPVGAKITADMVKNGFISHSEGAYLLSFCNNTSPMFVMNYLVLKNLKQEKLLLPSMLIVTAVPLLLSFVFRRFHFRSTSVGNDFSSVFTQSDIRFDFHIIDDCIMDGFEAVTKVGGYIILFSVLLSLCSIVPLHTPWMELIVLPFLEITNGISRICNLAPSLTAAYPLSLALTSFGGTCAIAQTNCMIQNSGLKLVPYITEKLVTALVTSLFAYIYLKL